MGKTLEGLKYGKWLVLSFNGVKNKNSTYLCECECGKRKIVLGCNLKSGKTKGCGCKPHKEMKVCNKCGKEKPNTLEYFARGKKKNLTAGDCKECRTEYRKIWHKENKDIRNEKIKEWKVANKDQVAKYMKQYREKNKEMLARYTKLYRKENREIQSASEQRRRARKKQLPSTLTAKQWEEIKELFHNTCAYCGKRLPLEQEHFIPLSKGGEYTVNNIIPACKSCNSSKGDKLFFEWYPKHKSYNKKREKEIINYLTEERYPEYWAEIRDGNKIRVGV